ncbi:MAG: Protein of unknown function (DUF2897) [Marinobacter excellens HL-55]|uniref:DUF2897 domain-containing protein n=1 Tax=Marinobacter excellens HL-55 TaxID=1305731 RepID=A0A0P8BAC5_9GAMM|nr:MAG: Protein of unknown function (DUF2897) [Marinobacter excellens HL-55]
MPLIGWLFILLAFGLVLGSLFMLRDSSNMKISEQKMKKILERKAELEAEEKHKKDD